jgi:hypothetical protein
MIDGHVLEGEVASSSFDDIRTNLVCDMEA